MQVAINTAVFLSELQKGTSQLTCLQKLVGTNINAVEVRGEFFDSATRQQELSNIATLCQQQHWTLYYSVPDTLFTEAGVNPNLAAHLTLAKDCGVKALKYSFGTLTAAAKNVAVVTALKEQIEASGIQVTIENQPNADGTLATMHQNLTWCRQQRLPLGYTFDAGNWYWIDQQPEAAFQQLQNFITVFHLKDIKQKETVLLGDGTTDWRSLLQQLAPQIPVFLEYAIAPAELPQQIKLVNDVLKQQASS